MKRIITDFLPRIFICSNQFDQLNPRSIGNRWSGLKNIEGWSTTLE